MTTYYVSASGGNNSNNGTSSNTALQTLQAAADLTKPGDTVVVENGTYTSPAGGDALTITTSGTANAPITYEAAPGANPIIEVPSSSWSGINVDASYIVVQGFTVEGDSKSISLAYAQSQDSITNNTTTTANGINIGYVGASTPASHVQILDNTVADMPGGGIQACYTDYLTVQGNTVYGNANYSPYGESGISIYGSQNSDNSTAVKNFIEDNTVYDNAELVIEQGTGAISDGEGIIIDDNSNNQTNGVQYTGGTLVENNLSYDNGSAGIEAFSSSNVDVLYNTTYQNGQEGVDQAQIIATELNNGVIENNIMYAGAGEQTGVSQSSTGVTWDYNLYYGGSPTVGGTHNVTANPLFINPSAGNFQTAAGSPAIGAANSAFSDHTDIAGNNRPGSQAEIGAYQYVSTTPTPTSPPSANDTIVKTGSNAAITDASGNEWTITSGGQVAIDGVADTVTANVIEVAYVNGVIWQENSSDLWWSETQPNDSWGPVGGTATSPLPATPTPSPTPAPTPAPTPVPTQSSPTTVTPSPNDTVVKVGSNAAITDASGNKWTITNGGQVAINGSTDTVTANVIELAYVSGTIWQENSSNLWWGETQPNEAWAPVSGTATSPLPSTPTPTPAASANDTVLKAGSTAAIIDASGNKWTITSGGQIAVNGTLDPVTANVIELAYVNGTVWQENSSDLWWSKTQPSGTWGPVGGTPTGPFAAVPSPNDTVVEAAAPAPIIDASGNRWTITSGGQIAINGVVDAVTANVIEIAYVNGMIWQENRGKLWWSESQPNDSWGPDGGTATSPLLASANGTRIATATASPIIDSAGNAWSLMQSASEGLQIATDGVVDPVTANVVMLQILNGKIEQENASGHWYTEPGPAGPWTQISAPTIDVTAKSTGTMTTVSGAAAGTTKADGDTFTLTGPGVAKVQLGSTAGTLKFIGLSSVNLTGGTAAATITSDGGTNSFTGGAGALTITGGVGADAYVYHAGDGLMTVEDFSLAKGDSLTADKGLIGSMTETSDGHGGVIVGFGKTSPGVHLVGVGSITASQIHFA